MELVANPDTELMPEKKTETPKTPPKGISDAKDELRGALKTFQDQTREIESNEKRLSEAQKEEQDLLAAEMEESEQLGKLNQAASLQRLLGSRIELGRGRLDSAEAELRQTLDEAFRAFWPALTALRDTRNAGNLAMLKKMVGADPNKWMWAEAHAKQFIRFASNIGPIDTLGDQAAGMLRSGAIRKAAESLLMDIAKLEAEGSEKIPLAEGQFASAGSCVSRR
jgi:hypothetical protein